MPGITDEDLRNKVQEMDDFIRKKYRIDHPKEERGWRTYEQLFSGMIREAMKSPNTLISEAVPSIHTDSGAGRPKLLTIEQRVKLLLIKQLVGESNRMFASMPDVFTMVSGINISYKTIERLYSDEEAMMTL
ncbi:MAG: hypothetical protein QXJ24_06650 [Thermoplasmatales archaeon]